MSVPASECYNRLHQCMSPRTPLPPRRRCIAAGTASTAFSQWPAVARAAELVASIREGNALPFSTEQELNVKNSFMRAWEML